MAYTTLLNSMVIGIVSWNGHTEILCHNTFDMEDIGLDYLGVDSKRSIPMFHVIHKRKFFLALVKYGFEYVIYDHGS